MDGTLNRLYELMLVMKKNPNGLRLEEISERVGASMARIRTDLEILSHEMPITNIIDEKDGEEYWYLISSDAYVPVPALNSSEVLAFLWAIDRQNNEKLNNIRKKLFQALFGREDNTKLSYRQNRMLIKGWRGLYDKPETEWVVERIEEAILSERRLVIDYRDAAGEFFKFNMEPYGLVFYWVWGFWYVVGNIEEKLTVLRLDRIEEFVETVQFAYPSNFSLEEVFADSWGVELTAPLLEIKIKFYDEYNVIRKVINDTAHRRNASIIKKDGFIVYVDRVRGINEIKPWIRSFGSSAVVIEPEELKEDMIKGARWVLELY